MKHFRRSDSDAIIILLVIIIIGVVLFPLVKSSKEDEGASKSELAEKKNSNRKPQYYKVPEKQYELFNFDPNTADSTQLLRLGLQPWQVRNIYKYRAAGGRYNQPTDFARLYGLTLKQYKRLEPYIKIEREVMAADVIKPSQSDYVSKNKTETPSRESVKDPSLAAYPTKIKEGERININSADTNDLKRIPGIGSHYARRIISFRERLGGIANVHQLLEIQGFPESSLKFMMVEQSTTTQRPSAITRIRINQLDLNTLSRHPYIRYVQAKEIMNYRRIRGQIKKADDLRRLPSFTDKEVDRLLPYIDFD